MAFTILYETLFSVEILHSYFLNDGDASFLSMNDDEKQQQLKEYNFLDAIDVIPSFATHKTLKNHKLTLIKESKGFKVLGSVQEDANKLKSHRFLNSDLTLTFFLYKKDFLFDNYTELIKGNNQLYYFSNRKPATEVNPFSYIPLNNSNDLITTDFLVTEESTRQLWFDIQQANINAEIDKRLDLIAEINQDDLITDEGKLIIEQSIQKEEGRGLLGVIELQMIGDNNLDL